MLFRLVLWTIYWIRDMGQVSNYRSHFAERNGVKYALAHCTLFIVPYSETVSPRARFHGQPQDTWLKYFFHVLIWFGISWKSCFIWNWNNRLFTSSLYTDTRTDHSKSTTWTPVLKQKNNKFSFVLLMPFLPTLSHKIIYWKACSISWVEEWKLLS